MRSVILVLALTLVAVLTLSAILGKAYTNVIALFDSDFSDVEEFLKHFDNATEVYDSGNDGSAKVYVDTSNGWLVFVGDNGDTSQGYDEPIAVVKGCNESNGFSSYAVLPYNYTVTVDFMVPSTPGYGNFYILVRYGNVNDKYEVVVDYDNNQIVFNKVVGGTWSNIASEPIGTTLSKDAWYRIKVSVQWLYSTSTNYIQVTLIDPNTATTIATASVSDSSLNPATYNGLAFLGFHPSQAFTVYMDNLEVATFLEEA